MTTASRGQVYHVDFGGDQGKHYYVVVSNNRRNRVLDSVLAVMLTTADKSHVDTAVPTTHLDSFAGYILADSIIPLWAEDVEGSPAGAISRGTMAKLNEALKRALDLS